MFEKEAEDFLKKSLKVDDDEFDFFKNEASCKEEIKRLTDFIEPREKRIAELEKENAELKEKISVLLSCKNCSENKGGWICVKEYENKCLAQKIEYIKELKKENAQLKKQQFSLRNERNTFLAQNEQYEKDLINFNENLTKAKELLRKFLDAKSIEETCVAESEAEQFISEVEK